MYAAHRVGGRVVGDVVAEVVGADLSDPLVVLVLVINQGGEQMRADDRHLVRGVHAAADDVSEPGVDAFGDGLAERLKTFDGREGAAELLGLRGV